MTSEACEGGTSLYGHHFGHRKEYLGQIDPSDTAQFDFDFKKRPIFDDDADSVTAVIQTVRKGSE